MFVGQTVWITGASAGIGRALAITFASLGGRVAVSARREDRLRDLVTEIESRGGDALAFPCDVSDETQLNRAADAVAEHFGRMDVAVANAGFGVTGRIEDLDASDWRRQLDVNVIGVALTARHALPHLRRTGGRLALVSSVAGMIPAPGAAAYAASKAAVRSIGQALSLELRGSGVSCTTLYPGFVDSEIRAVDNQGVFHADRREPIPEWLRWRSERAARVMARAIHRRERHYVFTGHGKVVGFAGRHWPALLHAAIARLSGPPLPRSAAPDEPDLTPETRHPLR
ncbi:MAG: SDR family NAD(P)-dependent oxidoreductase [Gemmatimonadetes bacterium]|nr:SDR family NAD(P)-dependent oxidoreductase [Gemmatimonadota bacterium]